MTGVYCKNCVHHEECTAKMREMGLVTFAEGLVDCGGFKPADLAENQCGELLDYLIKHGSATGMDIIGMGIMNYKGRVFDLRKRGYKIVTEMETSVNSAGEAKRYARYRLA